MLYIRRLMGKQVGNLVWQLRQLPLRKRSGNQERKNQCSVRKNLDRLGSRANFSPRDCFVRLCAGVGAIKLLPCIYVDREIRAVSD